MAGRRTAATREDGEEGNMQLQIQSNNQKVALAFRQKVAALTRASANKQIVNNFISLGADGEQHLVRLVKDPLTDKLELLELNGAIRNIPRALRAKRTADDAAGEDEEIGEEDNDNANVDYDNNDQRVYDDARVEIAAPPRKKKTAKSSSKKLKSVERPSKHRDNHDNEGDATTTGSRRSSRVTAARRSDVSTRSTRREPVIREDAEENHVTDKHAPPSTNDTEDHVVDESHLRRSLRAASDDLNSLSDRMNNFEIKSEAGSESTHIFSRENSFAGPVASTSAHC